LKGLIICINKKFQVIPPIPNAMTSNAVTLFLAYGNCDHIQFNIGIELRAKADPGITTQNTIKL
jgi:hypothetical protein